MPLDPSVSRPEIFALFSLMNSCHVHGTTHQLVLFMVQLKKKPLFKAMVSHKSLSDPSTSKMHQFFMSSSQFGGNQQSHFDAYDPMLPLLQSASMADPSSHLMDLLGASNQPNFQNQRLSLSLGYMVPGNVFSSPCSSTSYGTEALSVAITNSKFLKPAQELLDEVVNVGSDAIHSSNQKFAKRLSRTSKRGSLKLRSGLNVEIINNSELHSRLLKLIALLEEAERRYEQYYNHLDEMVSAFEMVGGLGAGRSYTSLALQAMCRHFSSLREAILSQIQATKIQILQEMPRISSDMSNLTLFDQETRLNSNRMSLQHIGLLPSSRQAWRPIRGLPDNSVNVLRSWLFEHFLHPYPNDAEKLTLSSQTGLSKNQVSNWFINARVRLWKPMIEEMYKEEFAETNPGDGFADSTED